MQLPLQITWRALRPSEAVEADVRRNVVKLEQFFDRIMGCRVLIEIPHRHQRQGRLHHLRIELTVPGRRLVVSRQPPIHRAHEDIYVAIRETFDGLRRRLQEHTRRLEGKGRVRPGNPTGPVVALFSAEEYGFIRSADGRDIYFHRNAVLDDAFPRLLVGSRVSYSEEQGAKGPQASTVRLMNRWTRNPRSQAHRAPGH